MVNPSKPPLPPNKPYHQPFNYPEYEKDFELDAHVKKFKAAIKINGDIEDAKIVNMFNFILKDTMFDCCNNYMGDYPHCTFVKL